MEDLSLTSGQIEFRLVCAQKFIRMMFFLPPEEKTSGRKCKIWALPCFSA